MLFPFPDSKISTPHDEPHRPSGPLSWINNPGAPDASLSVASQYEWTQFIHLEDVEDAPGEGSVDVGPSALTEEYELCAPSTTENGTWPQSMEDETTDVGHLPFATVLGLHTPTAPRYDTGPYPWESAASSLDTHHRTYTQNVPHAASSSALVTDFAPGSMQPLPHHSPPFDDAAHPPLLRRSVGRATLASVAVAGNSVTLPHISYPQEGAAVPWGPTVPQVPPRYAYGEDLGPTSASQHLRVDQQPVHAVSPYAPPASVAAPAHQLPPPSHPLPEISYWNPFQPGQGPLPPGVTLKLWDKKDSGFKCRYIDPFQPLAANQKPIECGSTLQDEHGWMKHFKNHAARERKRIDEDRANPRPHATSAAAERKRIDKNKANPRPRATAAAAVALKDSRFKDAEPWRCPYCNAVGKTARQDPYKRHLDTCEEKQKFDAAQAGAAAGVPSHQQGAGKTATQGDANSNEEPPKKRQRKK